jgi:formylglycine-generating enzyme required for sulfatase activity
MGFTEDEVEHEWDREATPQHRVAVNAFEISRYPITNAQYQCFIAAGGYDNARYWQDSPLAWQWLQGSNADVLLFSDLREEDQKGWLNWLNSDIQRCLPRFWEQRRWNNANHPVVGISWYEALAFCQWFNSLTTSKDKTVSLPTEAQWEYAARGEQNLMYSWGDKAAPELGNYEATGLARTSSVGLFEAANAFNEIPVQLYDLNGNVWEWTSSQWGKQFFSAEFSYRQWQSQQQTRHRLDQQAYRVLRGGSWNLPARHLRSAYRFRDAPDFRNYALGFRLARSQAK